MQKRVVLVGGGAHASDILAAYEARSRLTGEPYPVIGLVDDGEIDPRRFDGRGVTKLGSIDDLPRTGATHFVLALGWPAGREAMCRRVAQFGLLADIVIHPTADVPPGVPIGEGTVILVHADVSITAELGRHVYLSHGVIVSHDCRVADFVSIMPTASISGTVSLGRGCTIGANAAVIQELSVGAGATVGAGAVVIRNIPAGVTAVGAPARWKENRPLSAIAKPGG